MSRPLAALRARLTARMSARQTLVCRRRMHERTIQTIVAEVARLTQPLDGCPHSRSSDIELPNVRAPPPSSEALADAAAAHREELDALADVLAGFDAENRRAIAELCERTISRIGERFTELGVVAFPQGAAM